MSIRINFVHLVYLVVLGVSVVSGIEHVLALLILCWLYHIDCELRARNFVIEKLYLKSHKFWNEPNNRNCHPTDFMQWRLIANCEASEINFQRKSRYISHLNHSKACHLNNCYNFAQEPICCYRVQKHYFNFSAAKTV